MYVKEMVSVCRQRALLCVAVCFMLSNISGMLYAGQQVVTESQEKSALQKELVLAAANNDIAGITESLRKGADVNRYFVNDTALTAACYGGCSGAVEVLLGAGADADKANKIMETGLMLAAVKGFLPVVNILLKYGADPNITKESGDTALLLAMRNKKYEVVPLLIEAGADVNATNDEGWSALLLAEINKNENLKEILLKAGATWDASLRYAVRKGNLAKAKELYQAGASLEAADRKGRTPLFLAIKEGRKNVAKWLLEMNVDPARITDNGTTPLMEAAGQGFEDIVDMLLALHVDPEQEDYRAYAAWMYALQHGNNDLGQRLKVLAHVPENIIGKSCLLSFSHEDMEGIAPIVPSFTESALLNKIIVIGARAVLFCLGPRLHCDWTLFTDKSRSLAVIVPENIETVEQLYDKFGFRNLERIAPENATEVINMFEQDVPAEKLIAIFKSIIDVDSPFRPTRFLLLGHGLDGKSIAEIPIESISIFFDTLAQLKAEFLYILTCFAGGANLVEMQKQLHDNMEVALKRNVYKQVLFERYANQSKADLAHALDVKQEGAAARAKYIIVAQATADVPTHGGPRLKTLFTQLDSYLQERTALTERARFDEVLRAALPQKNIFTLASVRFPWTDSFFHAADLGNMEIVTRYSLQKARFAQQFEKIKRNEVADKSQELKEKVHGDLSTTKIILPIEKGINYIQIFSSDLHDCLFDIKNSTMPSFILKIYNHAICVIGDIHYISSAATVEKAVEDFVRNGFGNIFQAIECSSNKCWLIRSISLVVRGVRYNMRNMAIYIKAHEANEKGFYSFMYFDEEGYHAKGRQAAQDAGHYEAKVREWISQCMPSERAIIEASSGLESKKDCESAIEIFLNR